MPPPQTPRRPHDRASLPATGNGQIIIDLHILQLDLSEPEREALSRHLSPDERSRADRFVFARDRDRFLVGHGQLREILAGYVGVPPGELRFAHGEHGKPWLSLDGPVPHFNLSHSDDQAALVVSHVVEVGVDIEKVRMIERGLARRFFGTAEIAALDALPDEQWLDAFFRCWTRKEAVLKATGVGLTLSLAAFDVSIAADEPPRLLRLDGDPEASSRWSLFETRPNAHTIVAVAAVADRRRTCLRRMD